MSRAGVAAATSSTQTSTSAKIPGLRQGGAGVGPGAGILPLAWGARRPPEHGSRRHRPIARRASRPRLAGSLLTAQSACADRPVGDTGAGEHRRRLRRRGERRRRRRCVDRGRSADETGVAAAALANDRLAPVTRLARGAWGAARAGITGHRGAREVAQPRRALTIVGARRADGRGHRTTAVGCAGEPVGARDVEARLVEPSLLAARGRDAREVGRAPGAVRRGVAARLALAGRAPDEGGREEEGRTEEKLGEGGHARGDLQSACHESSGARSGDFPANSARVSALGARSTGGKRTSCLACVTVRGFSS